MSEGASSRTLRALALTSLLLVVALLSGCFGGAKDPDERLAEPTTKLVIPVTPTRPTITFNTSDPGYVVTTAWHLGDGWDYESNRSHTHRVRVVDQRLVNGTTKFLLEVKDGGPNGTNLTVSHEWVDSRGWLLTNGTDAGGGSDRYQPGVPLRFYRNGTFAYNHTSTRGPDERVTVSSRLFPVHQTLQFSWGYVEAKRVEQLASARKSTGERSEATTIHWVHKDYLNDVQFQLPGGETFKLVAAKAGDFRRGILAT